MKKILLSLSLVLLANSFQAQTNLLPSQGNFDFEGGSPTNAYWWYLGVGSGASANFVWQTTEKHAGNAAYQLNVVTSTSDQWRIQLASSYNESAATYPTVASGTSYTLRFWMKTSNGGGTVRFSNSGSSLWSADTSVTIGDWTLYSFTFTGNGTKFKPYLEFGKSAAGTYYIDDIALYETASLSVNDIVKPKSYVYPNPAKETINLSESLYSDSKIINIVDVTGRKVLSAPSAKTVNVSSLKKGVYIITNDKGESFKFIKD